MSDPYYTNQYPPPPSGQYYPRQDYRASQSGPDAYRGTPPPQVSHAYQPNTYQPPIEGQYRGSPAPPNMQVGHYREDYEPYDPRRYPASQPAHHSRPSEGYAPPPTQSYDDRPSSRDSRKRDEKKDTHHKEKSVGATLLGAAGGGKVTSNIGTTESGPSMKATVLTSVAFAGHEVGKGHGGGLSTLIGAVAGAYGGHELEKRHEKSKEKKRRESETVGYGDDPSRRRRSGSGRRSAGSRGRRDSSSSSDSDDSRRRRQHHHHNY